MGTWKEQDNLFMRTERATARTVCHLDSCPTGTLRNCCPADDTALISCRRAKHKRNQMHHYRQLSRYKRSRCVYFNRDFSLQGRSPGAVLMTPKHHYIDFILQHLSDIPSDTVRDEFRERQSQVQGDCKSCCSPQVARKRSNKSTKHKQGEIFCVSWLFVGADVSLGV
jgi:hypothetical protein